MHTGFWQNYYCWFTQISSSINPVKNVHFIQILSIVLALFTYYAQNYAGVISSSLDSTDNSLHEEPTYSVVHLVVENTPILDTIIDEIKQVTTNDTKMRWTDV